MTMKDLKEWKFKVRKEEHYVSQSECFEGSTDVVVKHVHENKKEQRQCIIWHSLLCNQKTDNLLTW